MTPLETIRQSVEESMADLPHEDRIAAVEVQELTVRITARQLAGEAGLDDEADMLRTAAAGLSGAALVRLNAGILEGVGRVVRPFLFGVLWL